MATQQASGPYIMSDAQSLYVPFEQTYKSNLIDNLETVLIGHYTPTTWPRAIKTVIADTIIRGRYKYNDSETRIHRIAHHNTLTFGEAPTITPFPRETRHNKRAAVLRDGILCGFNHLLSVNAFATTSKQLLQLRQAAASLEFPYNPDATSRLGAIATVIHDVTTNSLRDAKNTLDILLTAVTGIPSPISQNDDIMGEVSHSRDAHVLANQVIHSITDGMARALPPLVAEPGNRWKLTLLAKVAYVHKLFQQHGHHIADDDVIRTLSKIDLAHTFLETGVSLKIAGKKICFVAPNTLTISVTSSIADIYSTQAVHQFRNFQTKQPAPMLIAEDLEDMEASTLHPQYGQWTSFMEWFSRPTLADFISREGICVDRVAANSKGDVMFFVAGFGPWMPGLDIKIRSETTVHLLQQTVQGFPNMVPVTRGLGRKKRPEPATVEEPVRLDSDSDKKMHRSWFHQCDYRPRTLDAIVNKPGRVLVKRRGIRGSGGRFLAAGILALGVVAVTFNFAGRDNWLEIVFDGAQVMSLVAAVVVTVVYVLTGTLTSTLDWMGGVTEVTDEKQLAKILGVSVEEIKVACSYEKTFLFWLSEVNSCFCPAGRYGTMMFSGPLKVTLSSPHVKHGCVVGKDSGLWILQGWAFRIEKQGDLGHMIKVPYEDRVYVGDGKLHNFAGVDFMWSRVRQNW